jgi:zinc protease
MRAALLSALGLLAAGCAHPGGASLAAAAREDDAAMFRLPAALSVDLAALQIPELRFEPPEPRVEKLPNGLVVYLLEDRTVPLVQLRALVRLGNLDDPRGKAGLAQATWSALQTGGAGKLSAAGVDEALENMAALIDGSVDDESADLVLEVRSADLDKALPLFSDLLRRPRFEASAVARVLEHGRDAVTRRGDDAGQVAQLAFMKALWGEDSPFARQPTLASLARVKREDMAALSKEALVPAATRLVVTGDFDSAAMLARLTAVFGDWAGGTPLLRKLPAPTPPRARQVILVPTSGAQAKVRLGHLGPARHDPRELSLKLLDAVLGGAPGPSRLYTDIRDQRGLAYSIESAIALGPVRGLVLLAADTKPESTHEVIARCIQAVEALRGPAPPTAAEIALAREGFVNAFAFSFDTASRAAYLRARSDFDGYPADFSRTFRARLLAVKEAEVVAAAREALVPDTLQIVVVGDPRRIGDLSDFGPVRTVVGEEDEPAGEP